METTVLKRFKQNNGYFRSSEIANRAEKYQIQLLIRQGAIIRVKRGLYRLSDTPSASLEPEVAQIVPAGIFCMFTAWAYYNLTTYIPSENHIAVPKSLKVNLPVYPPVKIYFWSSVTIGLGLTENSINGFSLRMYDIERSVCDAVKFRNKIGTDIFSEILRNYLRRKDKNLDKLTKYASQLRIANTLDQLLQIIL